MGQKPVTRTIGKGLPVKKSGRREAAAMERMCELVEVVEYDFGIDGGTGRIELATEIPENSIITTITADVAEALVGTGATLNLYAASDPINPILTEDEASLDSADEILNISTPLLKTEGRLYFVIEGGTLTAGRVLFALRFYISRN